MTSSTQGLIRNVLTALLLPAPFFLIGQASCPSGDDQDGDDWTTEEGDCNDEDASVNPGAPELCEGIDNDCDGSVDEGCDSEVFTPNGGELDFDVAADGSVFTTQFATDSYGSNAISIQCFDSSMNLVGSALAQTGNNSSSRHANSVVVAPNADRVLVSWRDYPDNGVSSRLYDRNCQPITEVFKSISSQYGEFHDVAFDDSGKFVVAENDGSYTRIAWYDNNGVLIASDSMAVYGYGTHLAVHRSDGRGVLLVQNNHSGDVLTYRRFNGPGDWADDSLVQVPAGYIWWYDGATVGMNDDGDFAFEWVYSDGSLRAAFYDAAGTLLNSVIVDNTNPDGGSGSYWDSYRHRHTPIIDHCGDFILGEVLSPYAYAGTPVNYYRYTRDGGLVESFNTNYTWQNGMSHRMAEESGLSYFSNGSDIQVVQAFAPCN